MGGFNANGFADMTDINVGASASLESLEKIAAATLQQDIFQPVIAWANESHDNTLRVQVTFLHHAVEISSALAACELMRRKYLVTEDGDRAEPAVRTLVGSTKERFAI